MRPLRLLAVILPVLAAAPPLGSERPAVPPPPTAHAVDVWLGDANAVGVDPVAARHAERELLFPSVPRQSAPVAAAALGSGFSVVGSVAVLQGDEATTVVVGGNQARRGIEYRHLQEISRRFIEAFGDHYDQIAVFLGFTDYMSAQSLAYQMRVKNDVRGIGLDLFDATASFGSPSGRMQTMLNMKRILAYGRGAADDPENNLYAVWAQEAAHRWSAYLRFRRAGDADNSDALLGRQLAHWSKGVQADASIMDGYLWKQNDDGTFTATERDKRYGALDQYAMGLLPAKEVPPFYLLDEIRRAADDVLLDKAPVLIGAKYKARKIDLTIDDVVRALGPREPATDPAAADLRMGVVLLTFPGVTPEQVVGESFRIDRTRRLWDDFYNEAGGGRGKVCTQLLRPCRGLSLTYGAPALARTPGGGVPAPGDSFTLKVPVTNEGSERGAIQVRADGRGVFTFNRDTVGGPTLAPGASATLAFDGKIAVGAPCGTLVDVDFSTVERGDRPNPSRDTATLVIGTQDGPGDDLEEPSAPGWTVNPDGTDTATTGRWEQGTPERSEAFEFVVQPGAAWSGTRAFVTGAPRGSDHSANDVSGGRTTLQSPELALEGVVNPRLSYQVYFVAADFQNEVLVPAANDSIQVLASADGEQWTEVDRLVGMGLRWQRRLVKLADVLPAEVLAADSLRFRFVVEDADVNTVVEAAIDDVGLVGDAPSCSLPAPDGGPILRPDPNGCNCHVGARASGTAPAVLAMVGLALALARRRRLR
jgi:MYXO-CTERM domain-containing protein